LKRAELGTTGKRWPCALLLALVPAVALGQTSTSVLTGNVIDTATKAPVADVVVTATSPGLQGEQVVVTDATGLYRVPQLPPGTYTLRFEKETYRPYTRAGIDVAADRTLRLNVELLPETAGSETVTVVGTPPTVDIGSSATGTTINQEFVRNLAVARPGGLAGANRSFDSLATTAPQATGDYYGVGINGATSPENLYLIDGLSVNNPGFGTLGSPLTAEFMDEINVVSGGYMPEYGRTSGGAISAVTKSGGNEFHGSVWGTFTPGSLTGTPGSVTGATPVIVGTRELGNFGDVGATIGGFIIKDKLWFFAGVQWAAQRYIYGRSFNRLINGAFEAIPDSTQHRNGDERSWNYIGKLTFLISGDHRVSLTVTGTPTTGGGEGGVALRNRSNNRNPFTPNLLTLGTYNSGWTKSSFNSVDVVGELNSSFMDKRLLLDVRLGVHIQRDSYLPGDGSTLDDIDNPAVLAGVPSVRSPAGVPTPVYQLDTSVPASVTQACSEPGATCNVVRYFTGGPGGLIEHLDFDSYQARAVLTYLVQGLGHHVLKAGFDGQINKYKHDETYTGGVVYRDGQDLGADPGSVYDYRRFGEIVDTDIISDKPRPFTATKSTIVGGFIQDSWSIMDKVTLNLGLRYDALTMEGQDGKTRIALKDQWSPRVGVVWDPTQQGRSKIFANYGRYYEYIPLDISDRALSSSQGTLQAVHNCNPLVVGRTGCDANTRTDSTALINGVTQGANRKWGVTGGPYASYVDPDLKSPANDEVVAGAEYEVLPNARAGLTYTYRSLVRTVEDMSNNDGQTYFIGNPGSGIADAFPKAERTYHAVTVLFTKSFSDLWLAQVSYTWSKLTGNYDGLFNAQGLNALGAPQLDPNINSTFDLRTLLLNQQGPLSGDITHAIKVYLAKEFVITPTFSATLGGSFNANSGTPINALGAHPIYGAGQAFILERGSAGRLPWITSLDARVNLNYRISKDSVITAGIEAFNIFNSQRPLSVDENYTAATVSAILGARQGSVPQEFGGQCHFGECAAPPFPNGNGSLPKPTIDPASPTGNAIRVVLPNRNGVATPVVPNLAWGTPTNFQPVRQFRFSLRFTF
jgi:Carboxypeptidase regulatory-like domain/TonB dependent receptor-like, beta-barrel